MKYFQKTASWLLNAQKMPPEPVLMTALLGAGL